MRSDGFWIPLGLAVIASTLLWDAAGGGERGVILVFLLGAAILFRAVMRPVCDPFVPHLPFWQWALLAVAAAWVVGAVLLSPAIN